MQELQRFLVVREVLDEVLVGSAFFDFRKHLELPLVSHTKSAPVNQLPKTMKVKNHNYDKQGL